MECQTYQNIPDATFKCVMISYCMLWSGLPLWYVEDRWPNSPLSSAAAAEQHMGTVLIIQQCGLGKSPTIGEIITLLKWLLCHN